MPCSKSSTKANVDTSSTPQSQTQKMSPQTFFSQLATLMGPNPPSDADLPVVRQMARIGIVPGKPFDWNKLGRDIQREISRGVAEGNHYVTKVGLEIPGSSKENGWLINLEQGWETTARTTHCGLPPPSRRWARCSHKTTPT